MLDHEKYLKHQPVFNDDATAKPLDPALAFHPSTLLENTKPKSIVTPFDTAGLITSLICISDPILYNGVPLVLISSADKSLRLYDLQTQTLHHVFHNLHGTGAAVRSVIYAGDGIALTGGMDGRFVATDLITKRELGTAKAHSRFINAMAWDRASRILVSAGFDGLIKVYHVGIAGEGDDRTVEFTLLGSQKFLQIPTAVELVWMESKLILLACTQDSTVMRFLSIPPATASDPIPTSLEQIGKLNLVDAEFSLITFTPMHISISPDRKRYAVATSHSPHLRIIIGTFGQDGIDLNLLAHAPQDKFSIPHIAWSLDGKGIWCTGDDGVIRGIEVETGRLVAELKNGHDSKVGISLDLYLEITVKHTNFPGTRCCIMQS